MSFSVCFLVSLCISLPLTRSLAPASLPTHISFDIIVYCMILFSSFSFHYHSRDSVCSLACWTSVFVLTLLLPVLQPTPLSSSAAPLPIPFPLRFFPIVFFVSIVLVFIFVWFYRIPPLPCSSSPVSSHPVSSYNSRFSSLYLSLLSLYASLTKVFIIINKRRFDWLIRHGFVL